MKSKIFLTPTDTTIGFISQSKKSLDIAKKRVPNKVYITALPSLKALNKRVPKVHKNRVRRAKKTTFILNPTFSFRVVKSSSHNLLLDRLGYAYTSSANQSNRDFDYTYAYENADIVVYHPTYYTKVILESKNAQSLAPLPKMQESQESKPSTIYKLGKTRLKKIR